MFRTTTITAIALTLLQGCALAHPQNETSKAAQPHDFVTITVFVRSVPGQQSNPIVSFNEQDFVLHNGKTITVHLLPGRYLVRPHLYYMTAIANSIHLNLKPGKITHLELDTNIREQRPSLAYLWKCKS